MKSIFCETVEKGRDITDPRFSTHKGSRFGMFRFVSPFTGDTLRVIVGSAETHQQMEKVDSGWDHVSVSKVDKVPTWEEMCFIKDLFFDESETVVQYHPAKSDYINVHPNVLHLWRCPSVEFPMPPKICV